MIAMRYLCGVCNTDVKAVCFKMGGRRDYPTWTDNSMDPNGRFARTLNDGGV
jgi:hypothetical protein